jgi:hypothetical protein
MPLLFFKCGAAEHNAFINQAIITDLGGLSHHHTHTVVNKKSPPDFRTRVDFNSCEPSAKMRNQAGGCEPPPPIEGMSNAVKPDRMETRVTEKDLYNVFRSWIPVFDGTNIFL